MDFILYLITTACFVESVYCRTIPLYKDVLSEIEMNKDVSLNRDQERRGKLSWKKLKPILRREVQRSSNVNGSDARMLNPDYLTKTHITNSENNKDFKEHSSGHVKDMILKSDQRVVNNFINSDTSKINETRGLGSFLPSVTNTQILKLNLTQNSKDYPYNNAQDILTESKGSSVFLTIEDNNSKIVRTELEESSLLKEDATVTLKENQSTVSEPLSDFVANQIFIPKELATIENILNTKNFNDLTNNGESRISNFTFNYRKRNELDGIATTENMPIISKNVEYRSSMGDKNSTVLNLKNSYEDNERGGIFSMNSIYTQLDDKDSKIESSDSEQNTLSDEETEGTLQELSPDANYISSNMETKLIQTVLPVRVINRMNQSKFTNPSTEDYFKASSFTFNSSRENKLQEISTKSLSNISEIIENSTVLYEDKNTEMIFIRPFHDSIPGKIPIIGPTLPKCPDPGLCIFWWLAQDLCATDSHCHGALICCMWGCSKMCVEGENILS